MDQAEQLLEQHRGWVALSARRFAEAYHVDLDDLMQQGRLGILRAMETFNPEIGGNFLSYAKWWIRRYMQSWVAKNADQVRVPEHKFCKLGFSERSLQSLSNEDWEAFEACFGIEETIREEADQDNIRAILEAAVSNLSGTQARVIRALYFEGLTEHQAGAKFGVTHQAINMAKAAALRRLRSMQIIRKELAA